MLLVLVARHSERVEWLEKFGHQLLSFVEKGMVLSLLADVVIVNGSGVTRALISHS